MTRLKGHVQTDLFESELIDTTKSIVERVRAYASDENVDRFVWWSHPDRFELRSTEPWLSVFIHLT